MRNKNFEEMFNFLLIEGYLISYAPSEADVSVTKDCMRMTG